MRLGFGLPQAGQAAGPDAVSKVARRAEQLGFSSLWVFDRLLYPIKPQVPYPAGDGSLPDLYKKVLDPFGRPGEKRGIRQVGRVQRSRKLHGQLGADRGRHQRNQKARSRGTCTRCPVLTRCKNRPGHSKQNGRSLEDCQFHTDRRRPYIIASVNNMAIARSICSPPRLRRFFWFY